MIVTHSPLEHVAQRLKHWQLQYAAAQREKIAAIRRQECWRAEGAIAALKEIQEPDYVVGDPPDVDFASGERRVQKCEWIACEDRLPDDEMIVLAFEPSNQQEPIWLAYFSGEDTSWRWAHGGTCYPTHWMELPSSPTA